MSQLQERIAQFRKMASDDADNELGHFRLGQLLMEAQEYKEAIASFCRTLELSPQFSKVYQLLASCLLKVERKEEAVEILTNGWKIADERGDKMPRDEMGKMLKELGEPIPEATAATVDDGEPGTGFKCERPMCAAGKRARQLPAPPLADEVGQRIHKEICADCWNEWFKNYSIKVINELRIDLSTEFGQEEYDKHMRGFFGWEEAVGMEK
ncbi:MAG: Fe(2+)-trafficking protein [Planctomycetes bacterium]|nr:Fe(2+)-trafficking protein [Planctomycetota bacterium]